MVIYFASVFSILQATETIHAVMNPCDHSMRLKPYKYIQHTHTNTGYVIHALMSTIIVAPPANGALLILIPSPS